MERFGVMAAHRNKFIRLRLFFDYPPPAVVGCRMCWLLVDLNTCRVVADLESVIREKFEFSRSSILSLFIEDCYLPHTESIYVVRDNDNVRVKVECLPQVNGHSSCPETAAVSCKKRRRDTAEGQSVEHKKKKKKRNELEDRTADGSDVAKGDDGNKMLEIKMAAKKKKKKKKKRIVKSVDRRHPAVPEAAAASDIPSGPDKTPAGKVKTQNGPSSSPSRNGNEACHQKVAKKPSASPAASKGTPHQKPSPEKSQPSSSSASSQTDSSSDVADTLKVPARTKPLDPDTSSSKAGAQNQNQASSTEQPPLNQDSEEEIQLVIRQPQQPFLNIPVPGAWRGLGRGRDRRWAGGDPGECPRVRGQSDVERLGNGTKEPSYQTDSLSSKSVVLQTEAEPVPKDYSSMPLLAAPPQVGQKIAFKLLELTENYTPEVSEYKEGKIINFDPTTKQIELELLNASQAPAEPGKFDLVYQNPDGSERVEYAIQRGSSIMERWDSLLEPRLII
ncbi:coilin [Poeciliopsis prolifica]|uniref:coilin n=1 Tax=Poeciliopsis prolifica TaxID=188132 RepID=UPI0024138906|nr:coilin [Poeciliopsis prolifica]